MTLFVLAAGALILLSGLFFLIPRKWQGEAQEDLHRTNLEWYRLRQQEQAEQGGVPANCPDQSGHITSPKDSLLWHCPQRGPNCPS